MSTTTILLAKETKITRSRSLIARRSILKLILYTLLISIGLLFLIPFYWMVMSSFRPLSEFYVMPIPLIPTKLALQNYQDLFLKTLFLRGMLNTAFISVVAVLTQVFFCGLAGYTFAKLKFKWREQLFVAVLITMMIPAGVRMIPNFIIMSRIHWIDTYLPLIVPSIANAFGIFWMRQYCQSVSDDLLDAARIDGAGEFTIFLKVVMPIIQPALASLAIFVFLTTWNDFTDPLIFLRSPERFTIQLWLSLVSRSFDVPQPQLVMAGSVLSSIPILILFVALQRYFVAGLTAGSVK